MCLSSAWRCSRTPPLISPHSPWANLGLVIVVAIRVVTVKALPVAAQVAAGLRPSPLLSTGFLGRGGGGSTVGATTCTTAPSASSLLLCLLCRRGHLCAGGGTCVHRQESGSAGLGGEALCKGCRFLGGKREALRAAWLGRKESTQQCSTTASLQCLTPRRKRDFTAVPWLQGNGSASYLGGRCLPHCASHRGRATAAASAPSGIRVRPCC